MQRYMLDHMLSVKVIDEPLGKRQSLGRVYVQNLLAERFIIRVDPTGTYVRTGSKGDFDHVTRVIKLTQPTSSRQLPPREPNSPRDNPCSTRARSYHLTDP